MEEWGSQRNRVQAKALLWVKHWTHGVQVRFREMGDCTRLIGRDRI